LVKVMDANGKVILTKDVKNNKGKPIEIRLNNNFASGVYYVQVNNDAARKIIVQQ
jgi:Secretion system C-terminal sorting domain